MSILERLGNYFLILFPISRIYISKGIEGIYFCEDNSYIREATWIIMCNVCIGCKPFQFVLTLVLSLCSLRYYSLPTYLLFHMSWIDRFVHEQFMNRQTEPLQALRAFQLNFITLQELHALKEIYRERNVCYCISKITCLSWCISPREVYLPLNIVTSLNDYSFGVRNYCFEMIFFSFPNSNKFLCIRN